MGLEFDLIFCQIYFVIAQIEDFRTLTKTDQVKDNFCCQGECDNASFPGEGGMLPDV